MGLFDGVAKAFQNALANEDLPPAGPDGLSQDPWIKGVRKAITVYFVKDGEVVAQGDALPGDLLNTIASKCCACTLMASWNDVPCAGLACRCETP